MLDKLKTQAIQIGLVGTVFLLFAANACGLLDLQFSTGNGLAFRSFLFNDGGLVIPEVVFTAPFLVLCISGLLLSVLLPILSPINASLLTAAVSLPQFYIAYSSTSSTLLPMEYCLLTVLVLYAVNVLISYFRETVAKQKIVDVFGQYIPPQLVAEISKDPGQLKLEGESKLMTVFFCDLQDFTGVSEQLNPKQLARLLNEYFDVMTEILYSHGATIDKYIGDSIMCFWSAPITQKDHARRAVLSSMQMQKEIIKLSETFKKRGWPGPKMGVGINSGMMNVGNMGSKYRITYTVVGDAVNLAARLEGLTRDYHVPTIVSESTMQETKDVLFRALDRVQVKGKHNKTRIFEPLCLKSEADDALLSKLKLHHKALDFYFAENWSEAKTAFKQLRQNYKEDLYYTAMLKKIVKLES